MKKCLFRPSISLIIIFLFVGSSFISLAFTKINNNVTKDICDIPTWCIGDEWIYTADPLYYNSENGSFDGKIENLKHEVIDITSIFHNGDQFEVYQIDITGDITGEISWEELSGDLEGEIEGVSYIRITDLAEVKTEIASTGIVKIIFINRDYEMSSTNLFFPPLELYDFPLKVYEQWEISCNTLSSGYFILEDLIEEEFFESEWFIETLQCTSKESVSVPAGDFESYKVTYTSNTVWYSSEVGNVVKSEIDQSNENYILNVVQSLESFSRGTQPIVVTENIDPLEAIIDQEVTISGQAVDSETSDPIQNGDVSIEIPRIGEIWFTTTDDDGYYLLTIEAPFISDDTPSADEFGSDGVIVRCSSNDLSGYRVKTLLIIYDFPPTPPNIKGSTNGKKGVEYNYEFIATDPDGDDLCYFVEWGDGTDTGWKGPFSAGQIVFLSHKWNEEGTFTIRAKVKDDYGAESDWTELKVTMPRNKISYNPFFLWLLERFQTVKIIFGYQ